MLFYGVNGASPLGGLRDAQTDCITACGECGGQPCDGSDYNSCVAGCPNAPPAGSSAGSGYANACEACLASPTTTDCSGPCGTSATATRSGGSGTTMSTGNSQGSGTPWYASISGSITQGAVSAALRPGGAPVVAQPWYTTPGGMGAIAVGLIALAVFLAKK